MTQTTTVTGFQSQLRDRGGATGADCGGREAAAAIKVSTVACAGGGAAAGADGGTTGTAGVADDTGVEGGANGRSASTTSAQSA